MSTAWPKPIPAKCAKCRRNWIGRDAIRAPSLDNCRCFYCRGQLVPHPGEQIALPLVQP